MFTFFQKLSLSKKILLVILTVPVLLALVLTLYSARQIIRSKNQSHKLLAETISKDLSDKIDRSFYERSRDVKAFASNKLAVDALDNDSSAQTTLRDFVNTMTKHYRCYDLMMLCDLKGNVIVVNNLDKNGNQINSSFLQKKKMNMRPWFQACTASENPKEVAWASDFTPNDDISMITNEPSWGIEFAAPVKDANGKIRGVWYNFANWKEVAQGLRADAEQTLHGMEVLITNQEGKVIDSEDSSLINNVYKFDENDEFIRIDSHSALNDYTVGMARAGKNMKVITMIPKERLSLMFIFGRELIGLVIFDVICLFVVIFIGFRFSNRLSSRIYQMKTMIDDISTGKLTIAEIHGNDELSHMAKSLNTLTDALNQKSMFAAAIGQRSFDTHFIPISADDVLGTSLLHMRNNLKEYVEADQRQNWVTEGIAKFADLLRSEVSHKALAIKIVSSLVKYVDANQGALFILKDDEQEPYLELEACYAYDRQKHLKKRIDKGEGLLGQCMLEKDYILLTDVPQNYLNITSGLGLATPRCVLICPLKINDHMYGVIELASFKVFEPYQIDFVLKLCENIASVISNLKVNETTQRLLEEAQLMTEQMKAQEEEIRQNMEELNATQEELILKQKHTEKQAMLLDVIINKVPYPLFVKDSNSRYILANDAQAILTGIKLADLIQKKDSDFISNLQEVRQIEETDAQVLTEQKTLVLPNQCYTLADAQTKMLQTHKIPFINPVTGEKNILGVSVEIK